MDTSTLTLADHVSRRLASLCDIAGFAAERDGFIATFRSLVEPWANRPLDARTGWTSDVADDNTPIELSITLNGGVPEVRVLFEAQGDDPTLESFRRAGLRLHTRLESEFGADLARFNRVRDLFLPEAMQGRFAVWSSVVFARGQRPAFKAYFNPQASGIASAPALVEEALERLGFEAAWSALAKRAIRRGPLLDEIKYFALDLSDDRHARVKVYVHHHHVTAADLELACEGTPDYQRGEALAFVRAMRGGDERMSTRSPFTCHALTASLGDPTFATTLYVPVCAYARDDEVIRGRVVDYLVGAGIDPGPYDAIIRRSADRPLEAGVGMQSWVALRRRGAEARLTIYLATEAARVYAPNSVPAPTPDPIHFATAEAAIRRVAEHSLGEHPLARRLLRAPERYELRLLMSAVHEAAATHLGRCGDRFEGLGAALAVEIVLRQLVQTAARVFGLHDGERDDEEGAATTARQVPAEATAAFARGALSAHAVLWAALDELYRLHVSPSHLQRPATPPEEQHAAP